MVGHDIQLVIFDCDGVLVDSEFLTHRVVADMARERGGQMTTEQALRELRGGNIARTIAAVERDIGRALEPDFEQVFRARCKRVFDEELQPVEGIEQVLNQLPWPYCVASSGPPVKMQATLGATGLLPRVEGRLFSAHDIQVWKPAPDLFLHAAAAMGVAPEYCVVVEDTSLGVRAGVAAGMRVFGYAAHDDGASLREHGAEVFTHMRQLPALLEAAAG